MAIEKLDGTVQNFVQGVFKEIAVKTPVFKEFSRSKFYPRSFQGFQGVFKVVDTLLFAILAVFRFLKFKF